MSGHRTCQRPIKKRHIIRRLVPSSIPTAVPLGTLSGHNNFSFHWHISMACKFFSYHTSTIKVRLQHWQNDPKQENLKPLHLAIVDLSWDKRIISINHSPVYQIWSNINFFHNMQTSLYTKSIIKKRPRNTL